jgi:hypothetical protein
MMYEVAMDDADLPVYVRDKVQSLRRKGGRQAEAIDRLLKRRADATPEERERFDRLIVELAKPRRGTWIFVAVFGLSFLIVGTHLVSQHRNEVAVAAGVPVVAQITRVDPGSCTIGQKGHTCLKLTVRVHPVGRGPYTASLTHDIALQWTSRVQPGSWLTLAVDRADPTRVYFNESALAVAPPTPPPTYTP